MKTKVLLLAAILCAFNLISQAQIWNQTGADIDGEAAGDQSGKSIDMSMDGKTIAIGAWQNDGNGNDAGQVRVFSYENKQWTQVGDDIEGNEGEKKGFSVSLNDQGNIVALSTPYTNSNTGKVSVYEYIDGAWTQLGSDIIGKGEYYYSGVNIELSPDGKMIAISNHANFGFVRIYEYTGSDWNMVSEIAGKLYNEQLGGSGLKFNQDATILAARSHTYAMVRVFKKSEGGNWEQLADTIPDAASSMSLSLDGLSVAVGNGSWFGTVKVYTFANDAWEQKGNDMGGWFTNTGYAGTVQISSDGNMVLVSASGHNYSTGTVRTYTYDSEEWKQTIDDIHGEAHNDNFGSKLCLSANDSVLAVSAATNDGNGEDAGHVRIFQLQRYPAVYVEISDSICENELPYSFGEKSLEAAGTYSDTLLATNGADSIVTLSLTVHSLPDPAFTAVADTLTCTETFSTYQWHDQNGPVDGATSKQYVIEKSGTYYVKVSDEFGCSNVSDSQELIKTGIRDLTEKPFNMMVIPNPNNGKFILRFENVQTGKYHVQIINSLGQTRFEEKIYLPANKIDYEYDLSDLAKGNYFIRVFSEDFVKHKQFILK